MQHQQQRPNKKCIGNFGSKMFNINHFLCCYSPLLFLLHLVSPLLHFALAMSEKIFPLKAFPYAATVTPPGVYKIVLWDRLRSAQSANCVDIFAFARRDLLYLSLLCASAFCHYCGRDPLDGLLSAQDFLDLMPIFSRFIYNPRLFGSPENYGQIITRRKDVLQITLSLFKYVHGSDLEEFAECFEHFYTTQTNENGEFELNLLDTILQCPFYVHMFPLDGKMQLIHSSSEPAIFLQNVMKRKINSAHVGRSKGGDALHFFHYNGREMKVGGMLSRWVWQNANPTEEEAFLLKAYLRHVSDKLVQVYTNGHTMATSEQNMLLFYGNAMLALGQRAEAAKLHKKLAQIDGMPTLVRNVCAFLSIGANGGGEAQIANEFDETMPQILALWHSFCKNYLGTMSRRTSILLTTIEARTAEAAASEEERISKTDLKDEMNTKQRFTAAGGGTGVFHGLPQNAFSGQRKKTKKSPQKLVENAAGGTGVFFVMPK